MTRQALRGITLHKLIVSIRNHPHSFHTMPTNNRFTFRNVHIYNGLTRELLGGLKQNGSVTEATFLYMLNDILLITDAPLEVKQRDSERIILPTSNALDIGIYDVYCNGKCS